MKKRCHPPGVDKALQLERCIAGREGPRIHAVTPRAAVARRLRFALGMDILRVILAVVCPPLGVFLRVGFRGHFFLNIVLTFLGYLPGLIHAIWIIAQGSEHRARLPY